MTEAAMATSDEPRRCLGTNQDGTPCGAPSAVIMDDGFCFSHSPSVRPEARSAAGTLGGVRAGAKRRKGLDDALLGPLETAADAKRWTSLIARSVATGALSTEQGKAVLAAVREWRLDYEADELEARLAAWEAAQKGRG